MSTITSDRPRRYLALWFPFLAVDRLRRASRSREPDDRPLALVEKTGNALRLAAPDRAALALGLTRGLTLADARARVPDLQVVEMDAAADRRLLERLADFCDRYTPLVALDLPHGLVLDITGCAHLFEGEAGLREGLMDRLETAGIETCATVAGTPQAARALARFGNAKIVPWGSEAHAVDGLPVAALGIDRESVVALTRAGLKTVGDLAMRPRSALAARFGAELTARLARTLGEEDIRISPRRPLPACLVERRFAEPVTWVEEALESLSAEVGRLLEARGEGGRAFEASFFRTDGKVLRLGLETGRPTRDQKSLMRLFRERLDSLSDPLDAGFGFDLIRLSVMRTEGVAPVQASLDGRHVEEEEVAELVDRLGVRFGPEAVTRFVPVDTHIPERAAHAVPAAELAGKAGAWPAPDPVSPPLRPIHLFDPPQPIEALAEVPDGPPLRFRWRRVLHEIARAEGPERIAPEWWRHDRCDGLTRDYYRLEDVSGRRFWVFREGLFSEQFAPRWFMHGMFA